MRDSDLSMGNDSEGPDGRNAQRWRELERELARLRRYLDRSADGIFCFELDPPVSMSLPRDEAITLWLERARLVECNDAFTHMYGFDHADDLIGTPLSPFLSDSPEHNREYLRSFWDSGLRVRDGESQEIDRFGRRKYFLNTMAGVVEDGELVRVWGTQRDITEIRELEREQLDSQRFQAVEELAAGIAHHFNNMLTIISGNLSLTLEAGQLAREDNAALRSAARAAELAAGLTRQLLTFSQRHQQNSEPVDVRSAVMTTCQLLRPTLRERMQIDLDLSDAPRVLADPRLIQRLTIDLVEHARRAMNDVGTLHVQVRGLQMDGDAPQLLLRVSYPLRSGNGLAASTGSFDPFFSGTEEDAGSFTGLAEVYATVRHLGGTFSTETTRETVSISLQFPAEHSAPRTRASRLERPTEQTLATVLLVEDDFDVLATVRRFLVASGYRVLSAQTAAQAHASIEAHADSIDVLISDVVLPDKSGIDLARELRSVRPELRILLMSGRGTPPDVEPGLEDLEVLVKPFSRETLAQRIARLLEAARASRRRPT